MATTEQAADTSVVLDVGVLLDWNPRHLFSEVIPDEHTREWFLQEVCPTAWSQVLDWGVTWDEAIGEAVSRYPEYEQWIRTYDQRWLETVGETDNGTVEVLHDLRRDGVPVYALSNFSAEKWQVAREHIRVLNEFDGAVVSGEEQVAKPDERIYRILLERFELVPERTFYTDDTEASVYVAREVGIDAEQFTGSESLRDQLQERGILDDSTVSVG